MSDEQASSASAPPSGPTELGFDEVLERLRAVVSRLEQGSLSLEHSLLAFEEGIKLSRRGAQILDAAEKRVEVLTKGADGHAHVTPHAGGEGDGGP